MVEVPVVLRGLRDVASRYDVVLFDQVATVLIVLPSDLNVPLLRYNF